MFSRIAGDDNEVDSEELQDLLTTSLSKGRQGGREEGNGVIVFFLDLSSSVFSIDACRAMIAMLDVSSISV